MLGPDGEKAQRESSDALEKSMTRGGASRRLMPQEQREVDVLAGKVVEAWRKRQASGGG
jgi:hypothetical protein